MRGTLFYKNPQNQPLLTAGHPPKGAVSREQTLLGLLRTEQAAQPEIKMDTIRDDEKPEFVFNERRARRRTSEARWRSPLMTEPGPEKADRRLSAEEQDNGSGNGSEKASGDQ